MVTVLHLSGLKLAGTISRILGTFPSFSFFTSTRTSLLDHFLTKSVVSYNFSALNTSFIGINVVIPVNLSMCSGLEYIDSMGNDITGQIPEDLSILSRLEILNLGRNRLIGSIPISMASISSLRIVNLARNSLSGNSVRGDVPSSPYNISLTHFMIEANILSGPIPVEIGNTPPNLEVSTFLQVDANHLEGEIPESIGNLSVGLETLYMGGNLYFRRYTSLFVQSQQLEFAQSEQQYSIAELNGIEELVLSSNHLASGHDKSKVLRFLNLSFNNSEREVPRDGSL
ncbi:probable inactive leucine-rich repeat receptor kinase XIAO [Punica granatum]|uniref:Probable inactive leucine-rich repeat receptor kinase XIAO n=1 Tax=Punica granatum TaxID=22663 RepID=A0A6P8DG97_PUNGR|nr:probable inactive leucine-rich repeat receptor kinase XIAO [Punica granatum]